MSKFPPITFISAEKGFESKSEFSYRNYYEAKFIVAFLDYLTTLVYHKFNNIPYKDPNGGSSQEDSDAKSSCDEKNAEADQEPDDAEGSIGVILTYRSQVDLIQ